MIIDFEWKNFLHEKKVLKSFVEQAFHLNPKFSSLFETFVFHLFLLAKVVLSKSRASFVVDKTLLFGASYVRLCRHRTLRKSIKSKSNPFKYKKEDVVSWRMWICLDLSRFQDSRNSSIFFPLLSRKCF